MLSSLVFGILISTFCLWPQATQVSQISGTTLDVSEAAIPGASITVTNTETGISRAAVSGSDGAYLITNLPVGQYRLEARKSGFAAYAQTGIVLNVNTNPHIDVTMKVGGVSEQIEVNASAAMVETHSNGVGQVIDQNRVVGLPLNGRTITQLVTKNYPTSSAFSVAGGQAGRADRLCYYLGK